MAKKKSIERSYWIPIDLWNLNELFTTESISPISFYQERDFGNPANRNHELIEDTNKLILFGDAVQSDILLNIKLELLDTSFLKEIKNKKAQLKSFEYSKTIYLKKGFFNVCFSSQEKLNEFLNNTFMLLEVKTVNKYKDEFIVNKTISNNKAYYVSQLFSDKNEIQPYLDKALNQIKGLIYGYLIGSLGTLEEKGQGLVTELSKLKNTIGGIHTDIALTEQYSNLWLINVRKQINDCQKSYSENFGKKSDVFDTLLLRLQEIDNLNKMRCDELSKQNSPHYKRDYEHETQKLEKVKRELYKYECKYEITTLKEEFLKIKQEEKERGVANGKTRKYYKASENPDKYYRKKELKTQIEELEKSTEYQEIKKVVEYQKEKVRNFQFGGTQFDTSISEQFSRITEYLHEIIKTSTNFFLSKNNKVSDLPDISFEFDIRKLANYYFKGKIEYTDFSVKVTKTLEEKLTKDELNLFTISINSILSQPQGRLGNYSEQSILDIIGNIGKKLTKGKSKDILRGYYLYRVSKNDTFNFPENAVLANLIVFFMKLAGHEQINKMLVSRNIYNRQIAFLLYGAYLGFANLPKTFTNLIFDSDNRKLQDYIDDYLFENILRTTSN